MSEPDIYERIEAIALEAEAMMIQAKNERDTESEVMFAGLTGSLYCVLGACADGETMFDMCRALDGVADRQIAREEKREAEDRKREAAIVEFN